MKFCTYSLFFIVDWPNKALFLLEVTIFISNFKSGMGIRAGDAHSNVTIEIMEENETLLVMCSLKIVRLTTICKSKSRQDDTRQCTNGC